MTIEGGYALNGTVQISGSKNAALPLLAAVILLDGETTLTNVADLMDVKIMVRMLKALDIRAEYYEGGTVKVWNTKPVRHMAPYDLVTAMRASFFVAGPILARRGFAKVPLPGGCAIGSRPVDIHLDGFRAMGASIEMEHGFVMLRADQLKGADIRLSFPSVGATENLMMAACLATGTTVIHNAAAEPEISDLGHFLNAAGAKITGHGTATVTIDGVSSLRGVTYRVIPDRIEAGTLLIAAPITKGDITVTHVVPEHLKALSDVLIEMGVEITQTESTIRAKYVRELKPVSIETQPFPGFPTDIQAQMMSLLTVTKGRSAIYETIFENRFMHANELNRMGANITLQEHCAIVEGVESLSGADVKITDLRAGAALILAGLAAKGYTTVYGLRHLHRGYENLDKKLMSLGARIHD